MIEKQRLEELIERDATIFITSSTGIQKENLSKENNIDKENTLCWRDMGIAELEYLFETKEDAEFALRFKRIPRTEYLDLPSWEEFCSEDKLVGFTVYPHNYHLLKVGNYIYLRSFYGYGGMDIFNKPLTKENYLEVCELCRKLWLGEEV